MRRRGVAAMGAAAVVAAVLTTGVAVRAADSPPVAPAEHGRPAPTMPPLTSHATLSPDLALVATAHGRLAVYRAPHGAVLRHLSRRTQLGSVRTLLVTDERSDGWLRVELPVRPNGTFGWVRAGAVTTATTPMRIVVSRRHRTLTLLRAGTVVAWFPVAVGAPATPTPPGLFYVIDRVRTGDPAGPFGPYALGLSGFSNVLTSFDGGDGVIGIHGTNADWSVGEAASHGCVRMHDADIPRLFREVPLGTPVIVR